MQINSPGFVAEVKDLTEKYIQDTILLAKLEASERVAILISKVYIFVPLAFLSLLIMSIFTFLSGYYLSIWLGAYWAGFGSVLIFYVLVGVLLVYLHHKKLKQKVANKVVESIFSN